MLGHNKLIARFSSNLQTPEDKYPVCDVCLSGKKTFVKKRGGMAGKEKAK